MKEFIIKNQISVEAENEIKRIIDTHTSMRHRFYDETDYTTWSRRKNVFDFFQRNPDVRFTINDDEIIVFMMYSPLYGKISYRLIVLLNDEKKDIRLLKKLLKEIPKSK